MKVKSLILSAVAALFLVPAQADAQRVVILSTNDTHSQIDPKADNKGGILRRKVLIDSIRGAEKNVVLVDAGDAVQGSLFFTLFDGEVEQKMLNALGYDIQILGNHEFDNGLEKLKKQYEKATPTLLSTNYDFSATPLAGMFQPYVIKNIEGKRIAFIGVNVQPKGLIDPDNYAGMNYYDDVETANALADYLKNELKVDRVVAITHIGYSQDRKLVEGGRNIDAVIGGHSHDFVFPSAALPNALYAKNLDGKVVPISQMGKSGLFLGEMVLDFDDPSGLKISYEGIPVDARLDSRVTPEMKALLAPYRHKVDSISAIQIGQTAEAMASDSWELSNLLGDWVYRVGERMIGRRPDFGMINRGGIRNGLPAGTITQGNIIEMLPFNNRVVVVEMKGSDLQDLFGILARQGGQAVSSQVKATYNKASGALDVKIGGKKIDPNRMYTVATIDYLQRGGDNMTPFVDKPVLVKSPNLLYRDLIDEFTTGDFKGVAVKADPSTRMKIK